MSTQNPFDEITTRLQRIEKCLTEIQKSSSTNQVDPEEENPVNIIEAANILKLAVPTLYGLVHKRQIPFYRRGGRLYFFRSQLLEYIKSGRRATMDEIKQAAANSLNR